LKTRALQRWWGKTLRRPTACWMTSMIYMHSTGISDTKSSYLEGLRTGVWDYQSVDRADQRIQADGDVVLVFCKMSIRLISRGVVRAFDSRALAVWVRKADGWRLLAVQSGAIPNAS
jgi:ketosteroid isomerase-like protein